MFRFPLSVAIATVEWLGADGLSIVDGAADCVIVTLAPPNVLSACACWLLPEAMVRAAVATMIPMPRRADTCVWCLAGVLLPGRGVDHVGGLDERRGELAALRRGQLAGVVSPQVDPSLTPVVAELAASHVHRDPTDARGEAGKLTEPPLVGIRLPAENQLGFRWWLDLREPHLLGHVLGLVLGGEFAGLEQQRVRLTAGIFQGGQVGVLILGELVFDVTPTLRVVRHYLVSCYGAATQPHSPRGPSSRRGQILNGLPRRVGIPCFDHHPAADNHRDVAVPQARSPAARRRVPPVRRCASSCRQKMAHPSRESTLSGSASRVVRAAVAVRALAR